MDHDANLETFLKRCEDWHVRLNRDKIQLWLPEVPFIGHAATAQGVQVDPHKVQAILEMLPPVSKFMRHLSDVTKPLRELTQRRLRGPGDLQRRKAWRLWRKLSLKHQYWDTTYNAAEEVTVQCDASQYGLGAVLLQKGQPVTYASWALTDPETRYICTNWERALVHSFRMWVFQVVPLWTRNHKCRNRSPASWVKAPP